MSFRCQRCQVAQQPGAKPTKVVTEIREKTANGSVGHETVTELELCASCATVTEDVAIKRKKERNPYLDAEGLTSTLAEAAEVT